MNVQLFGRRAPFGTSAHGALGAGMAGRHTAGDGPAGRRTAGNRPAGDGAADDPAAGRRIAGRRMASRDGAAGDDGFADGVSLRRPGIPPVLGCAAALWASCAAAFSAARLCGADLCFALAVASALASLVGAAVGIARRRMAWALAVCLALGCCLGMGEGTHLHALARAAGETTRAEVQLTLLEDASEGGYAPRALAQMDVPGGGSYRVEATFPEGTAPRYGQRVRADAAVSALDIAQGDRNWSRGTVLSARLSSCDAVSRHPLFQQLVQLRSGAIDRFCDGSQEGALLAALVCGYRPAVRETDLYAAFQTCGLAHLIAVSGAHLVIVTGLFASLLRAVRAPRAPSIVLLVATMCAYLVFSGAPVSALRATVMSSVGVLSYFGKRRPSSLGALGLCVFVLVATAPHAAVSVSFALSALSTAGIVVFSPLVGRLLGCIPVLRAALLREPLALTLSAAVLSQPLACALFYKLPLVSPLANVVCAPLFPLACACGLVCAVAGAVAGAAAAAGVAGIASAIASAAATACWWLSRLAAAALHWLVNVLSAVPFACVPVAVHPIAALALSAAMAAALWLAWNRLRLRHAAAALGIALVLMAGFAFSPDAGDRIVMLDVGQGDAFLLASRGSTLLIDTGNHDAQLLAGLAANHLAHVDSVLVTHGDDDHCGSLDAIAQAVDVDRVILAAPVLASESPNCTDLVARAAKSARQVVGASWGDSFSVGAFSARVVWPHSLAEDGGNGDSLCLYVEYDGDADGVADATALFTGDAEADQLRDIIAESGIGSVDILKVGHHGSRNGMDAAQARTLHPRIALIGVGANNRYGHPADEILGMLEGVGCAVYRTDQDGEVRCMVDAHGIRVRAMN
ncbi:MAG TPA: DNA internalization-related competence protein ComEC/Rec2 [Eggerthellaceae bacterium]|nr:DNA internalization-related competence protein ComEC/Rec2 [Eggerthellaceae bacterium]